MPLAILFEPTLLVCPQLHSAKPAIYIHWVAHGGTIVARAWPTAACCFSAEGNSKHASNRTPGGRGRREVQSLSVPRARSKCGFFECARDQLCDPQALELVISMQTLRNLQRSCCVQALERVLDRVQIFCVYTLKV